jgi:rhamnose transport system substrate-binding protein
LLREERGALWAGRLGEYKIGANGEVVLGPAQIVTPKNVEEFKF